MADARTLIHDLINALTIAEGMANIIKSNVTAEDKKPFEENLQKLDKVIKYLEIAQKDVAELRELSKQNNW
jgi:hypothetical protein